MATEEQFEDEERRDEWARLRDRLIDVIEEAVKDTEWGPTGEPGVLAEIVVVMGWSRAQPGQHAMSYFRSGSTWSSKGLVREALEEMKQTDGWGPREE